MAPVAQHAAANNALGVSAEGGAMSVAGARNSGQMSGAISAHLGRDKISNETTATMEQRRVDAS
jgi:hypothetical protein